MNRITATLQKNVLVTIANLDASGKNTLSTQSITMNHKKFALYLENNVVEAFLFRASDEDSCPLMQRRCRAIKQLGFDIIPSQSVHHNLYAYR